MAKGFDRLHIKSAVKSRNRFNLSFTHLTTADFGQVIPLLVKEMSAGDVFPVKANYFSRMAPLVKPTYGKFSFRTLSTYVPFHQVAYDFDAWQAGKRVWEGITPSSRYFDVSQFFVFLTSSGVSSGSTATDYDFSLINGSGTLRYFKFTRYGQFVIKLLNCLGYTIFQNVDLQTSSAFMTAFGNKNISALPLLCYAKAYNDYMSQSQRFNSSQLTDFLRCVKYNTSVIGYDISTHKINATGLDLIFRNIKLCYENDYFMTAWQWPNSPLNVSENLLSAEVPSEGGKYALNGLADNVVEIDTNYSSGVYHSEVPQRALDWLKSFDAWVRRNNYSGSRAVQQIYSRFGIKPDDYRSHYAEVIKTDIMPIQVGDVTATTMATGQPLGDYAGKGILSNGNQFEYKATDKGLLFVLGWYTVTPMMSYGMDRLVLKTDPLQYYTPEFDGIGADAISAGEVFTDPKNSEASDSTLDNYVFGFTERYNEYRFSRDMISGDFRKYDNTDGMNTWHTGRLLQKVRAAGEMVAQSSAMNTLPQYDSEYQRIFSMTGIDPFYLTCQFEIKAIRPMLSLNQVPNLGEGDLNIPRNGNEIN